MDWKTQWMNEYMNKKMNGWMNESDLWGELPLSFLRFLQVLLILHVFQSHLYKNIKVIMLRAVIKIIVHLMLHRRFIPWQNMSIDINSHRTYDLKKYWFSFFFFTLRASLTLPYLCWRCKHAFNYWLHFFLKQNCLKLHLNYQTNLNLHTGYKLDTNWIVWIFVKQTDKNSFTVKSFKLMEANFADWLLALVHCTWHLNLHNFLSLK